MMMMMMMMMTMMIFNKFGKEETHTISVKTEYGLGVKRILISWGDLTDVEGPSAFVMTGS
jgi:hypothetical protein